MISAFELKHLEFSAANVDLLHAAINKIYNPAVTR